jgi:hypothetical protein
LEAVPLLGGQWLVVCLDETGWNAGSGTQLFRPPVIGPDGSIIAVLGHAWWLSARGDKLWKRREVSTSIHRHRRGRKDRGHRWGWHCGLQPDGKFIMELPGFGQGAAPVGPAMDASGFGYVPLSPLGLAALNPSGRRTWAFKLETAETFAFSGTTMAADGTLYAGTDNGRVMAIKSQNLPARSSWPMFLHDAQHTSRDHRPFLRPRQADDGSWSAELLGELNTRYSIEVSDDLAGWIPLSTLSTSGTNRVLILRDVIRPEARLRFYRAR